jgi:hypothetical protein
VIDPVAAQVTLGDGASARTVACHLHTGEGSQIQLERNAGAAPANATDSLTSPPD